MKLKYFKLEEFNSPDAPSSGNMMNITFLQMLDKARDIAGIPFVINSGYRTQDYNEQVGGVPRSSHTTGRAADIRAETDADKARIIWACAKAGFNRIGLGSNFVHVDSDDFRKPSPAFWDYSAKEDS